MQHLNVAQEMIKKLQTRQRTVQPCVHFTGYIAYVLVQHGVFVYSILSQYG